LFANLFAPHRSLFGFCNVPAAVYPWALLILLQIMMPGISFLGHLSGILCGAACASCCCTFVSRHLISPSASLCFCNTCTDFHPCPSRDWYHRRHCRPAAMVLAQAQLGARL
jgi:hypothetical protein